MVVGVHLRNLMERTEDISRIFEGIQTLYYFGEGLTIKFCLTLTDL